MSDIQQTYERARRAMEQSARQAASHHAEGRHADAGARAAVAAAGDEASRLAVAASQEAAMASRLAERVDRDLAAALAIGERVGALFEKLLALFEEIAAEEEICQRMEVRIQQVRAQSSLTIAGMGRDQVRAYDAGERIERGAARDLAALDQISLFLGDFDRAREQVAAITQQFFNDGFKSVHRAMEEASVEAFLADQQERLVRIQVSARQETESLRTLALDMVLDGFSEEDIAVLRENIAVEPVPAEDKAQKTTRIIEKEGKEMS